MPLLQSGEDVLCVEAIFEGDHIPLHRLGEDLRRRTEFLRDGYQHAVPSFAGFSQEGDPLDEVALRPEAQYLQVHALPGALQVEVRYRGRLFLREGQPAAPRLQLPAAGILRALPGAHERPAHRVRLVLFFGPEVVAFETARLRVKFQDCIPVLPLDARPELPGRGQEQAREELCQPQPVLARGAEDGYRAIEAEPVSARGRFERVDQTQKLYVVEDEPGIGPFAQVHDELPRGVEHALYLGHVVTGDELLGRGLLEPFQ